MITWCTRNVPQQDVVFPRLHYSNSRCSQVLPGLSSVFPDLLSAFPDLSSVLAGLSLALPDLLAALSGAPRWTQWSHRRFKVFSKWSQSLPWYSCTSHQGLESHQRLSGFSFRGSDTLLQLTHFSVQSTSSQTLLVASSDQDILW